MLRLSLKKNSFLLANFIKDEMKGKRAMFELVGKKYYVSGVKTICFLLCVSRLQKETCFHYLFVFYDHGKRHANKTSQKEQALANKRQKGGVKKRAFVLVDVEDRTHLEIVVQGLWFGGNQALHD